MIQVAGGTMVNQTLGMAMAADGRQGVILHLQRLSTEDGPGLRTTVFFKGCPLRCAWCHNPESISTAGQLQWLEHRCIGCDTCAGVCPRHALSRSAAGLAIDRACCEACGECAEACPANALELLGRRVGVDELAAELAKDRAFFEQSGGGVTLSGGEPTLQAGFAARLLEALRARGIPAALDTCGLCAQQTLERLVPLTHVVLYDVKLLDPDRHVHFTGQSNRVILDNLRWLGDYLRRHAPGTALWVRTPLIPGATATAENVAAIGAFLAAHLGDVLQRWELCAFNNLCRAKYLRLGLDWAYAETPLLARAELDELERIAQGAGLAPEAVAVTGVSRLA